AGDGDLVTDHPSGMLDGRPRDKEGIDADQRKGRLAIRDNGGDGPQLVADTFADELTEPAGDLHADRRGNVRSGETEFEHSEVPPCRLRFTNLLDRRRLFDFC